MSTKKQYHTCEKGCDTAITNYSFLKVKEWEGLTSSHSLGGCAS